MESTKKPLKNGLFGQLRIHSALTPGVGANKIGDELNSDNHEKPQGEEHHEDKHGEHKHHVKKYTRTEYHKIILISILQFACAILGLGIGLIVMMMQNLGAFGLILALLLPFILAKGAGAILYPLFEIEEPKGGH